jgi:hypothetical protein
MASFEWTTESPSLGHIGLVKLVGIEGFMFIMQKPACTGSRKEKMNRIEKVNMASTVEV